MARPNEVKTSPKLQHMVILVSQSAHVHAQRMKTCTLLLCLFYTSFGHFFFIFEALPDQKFKNRGHTQKNYGQVGTFLFYTFFPFQSGRPSKWPKCVKNVKKSPFLPKYETKK